MLVLEISVTVLRTLQLATESYRGHSLDLAT